MKIVIPTEGKEGLKERTAEHFGRCPTFTFLDENGKVLEVVDNTSQHMGGQGLPPELMKKHGADVLLCQGLGPRAIEMCNGFGIKVYVTQAETVECMFNLWKDKKIDIAGLDSACKDHQH